MSSFAIIGAAGYIAPRHLRAIKDTGGTLTAAFDINDSVGIMDSFFPDSAFFTEFELFEEYMHTQGGVEFVSICSPNYLHKSHISYALRSGSNAICEKPLVLNPSEIEDLQRTEVRTGNKVYSILQLRLHPAIVALRNKIQAGPADKIYNVDLSYFTSRGAWYHSSWKGMTDKSGGIASNIGVHFFDMLSFIFGQLKENVVHHRKNDCAAGYLEFEKARVRWVLSINRNHLPPQTPEGQTTYRSITVEGEEIEFSGGFTDLHTDSYKHILAGNGFGLDIVRPSIEIVKHIRDAEVTPSKRDQNPLLREIIS